MFIWADGATWKSRIKLDGKLLSNLSIPNQAWWIKCWNETFQSFHSKPNMMDQMLMWKKNAIPSFWHPKACWKSKNNKTTSDWHAHKETSNTRKRSWKSNHNNQHKTRKKEKTPSGNHTRVKANPKISIERKLNVTNRRTGYTFNLIRNQEHRTIKNKETNERNSRVSRNCRC